jgi:hypothetical protein
MASPSSDPNPSDSHFQLDIVENFYRQLFGVNPKSMMLCPVFETMVWFADTPIYVGSNEPLQYADYIEYGLPPLIGRSLIQKAVKLTPDSKAQCY